MLFTGLFFNIALYILILYLYDYPGWDDLFYDTFIHRRLNILNESSVVEFKDYWHVLSDNLINFKKVGLMSLSMLMLALFLFKQKRLERSNFFLILLMFCSLYIKFLFFPAAGETRFFVVYLFMMGIFILNPKKPLRIRTI